MTSPTLHDNGTGRDTLIATLETACEALDAAYTAIRRTAPNIRDYPRWADLTAAESEWMDRLRRIDEVKAELQAVASRIGCA